MDDSLETRRVPDEGAGRPVRLEGGHIVVTEGPDKGRRFVVGAAALTIGKAPDNGVVLVDDAVSKHHLAIEETPDGFLLRDLKSTNGTTLDGVRVREAFLNPGAVIGLGATRLRFEPAGKWEVIEPTTTAVFGAMTGRSLAMRQLFGVLARVARAEVTILVTGETGAGKDVVARTIHEQSARAAGPFAVVDASASPRDLFESILFGHQQGAFTGAAGARKGAFVTAHRGTLFIDEIGELPLDLQPKLLRALEMREVVPLGADRPQKVDVRVIAATHRDLKKMVAAGTFRQDLFYRLSVVQVRLPPLRERLEDLDLLVQTLLERAGRADVPVGPGVLAALRRHRWEGNVRELKNTLDRALAFCGDGPILPEHVMLEDDVAALPAAPRSGDQSLDEVEAEAIRATLEKTGGNRTHAAKILGISRRSLIDRIARHGIASKDED